MHDMSLCAAIWPRDVWVELECSVRALLYAVLAPLRAKWLMRPTTRNTLLKYNVGPTL